MPTAEVCACAARIVHGVTANRQSLEKVTKEHTQTLPLSARSEAREIAWGTVRWWFRYRSALAEKLHRPISRRDKILESLLMCGVYQYDHLNEPDYAVTSGTVEASRNLGLPKAAGFVNAVLRAWLRDRDDGEPDEESRYATPRWLIDSLKRDWPHDWQAILEAGNQKPPMSLRINALKTSRSDLLALLSARGVKANESTLSPWGITLEHPQDVATLPGFLEGLCSVQDTAAQLIPLVTQGFDGGHILDACAAPGGKTAHLLESLSGIESLTAVDLPERTPAIAENLRRLDLSANVISSDILETQRWWDQKPFDLILIDAPCSGTGVIKRHPDIRHHRRPDDIPRYAERQEKMLKQLWPMLKPGGQLIYVTCSILHAENNAPVEKLIGAFRDARVQTFTLNGAIQTAFGYQLLPTNEHDGLFYANLRKA